uniref:DUF502 domain-containing protein n=1 Tax=Leptospirillum ferrodiazotrophum TaxID=412449 RepID=C6HUX7_9BACT|nr:MAG: conserved protein of unknown function [Leptospirillum ferrodiazotrophum]
MGWIQSSGDRIRATLKTQFITGLVIVLPVALSGYIFYRIFLFLDSLLDPLVTFVVGRPIPGLGVAVLLGIIFLTGIVATNVIGRKIVSFLEGGLTHIPIFKKLYTAVKTMLEAFSPSGGKGFRKVVLAEYPKAGAYTMGFLTQWVILDGDPVRYASIFFPSNNLYIGVQAFVPESMVRETGIPVEEGIRMILSGGLGMPERLPVVRGSEEVYHDH